MRIHATAAMAAVFLCAVSLGSAQTATPGGPYVYGAGAGTSCGTWLAERGDSRQQQLWVTDINWVLGWVSAAGHYNARGNLRHTDHDAVSAWLDKYCREHPLDPIYHGADALVDELAKTK